jgi:hypothetical protein
MILYYQVASRAATILVYFQRSPVVTPVPQT